MNRHDAQDQLIEDVRAKQENALWPRAMVNSSGVDALLWKGSPDATKIQRIGIAIFGLACGCVGAVSELGGYEKRELFLNLFGLPRLALAARLLMNAFKRNPKPAQTKNR